MVREAGMRVDWFRESLHVIQRVAPILWYRRRASMFDFANMESLCADPAYRNREERVKEFKYKVRFAWTRGQVDEIERLERIGMHNHAEFLKALQELAGSGDRKKAQEMVFSAQVQARLVKVLMGTHEYKTMMDRLDYPGLFRNMEARRSVPDGATFIWKLYDAVLEEMQATGDVPVVPAVQNGAQSALSSRSGHKSEMVAWLTAPSTDEKKIGDGAGGV